MYYYYILFSSSIILDFSKAYCSIFLAYDGLVICMPAGKIGNKGTPVIPTIFLPLFWVVFVWVPSIPKGFDLTALIGSVI